MSKEKRKNGKILEEFSLKSRIGNRALYGVFNRLKKIGLVCSKKYRERCRADNVSNSRVIHTTMLFHIPCSVYIQALVAVIQVVRLGTTDV